jgi:hypothetical protein
VANAPRLHWRATRTPRMPAHRAAETRPRRLATKRRPGCPTNGLPRTQLWVLRTLSQTLPQEQRTANGPAAEARAAPNFPLLRWTACEGAAFGGLPNVEAQPRAKAAGRSTSAGAKGSASCSFPPPEVLSDGNRAEANSNEGGGAAIEEQQPERHAFRRENRNNTC